MKLLGKITEVALFTERREVVQVTDSAGMREKLLQSLQLAINNSKAIDAEYTLADDLLSEIAGGAQGNDEAPDHAEPASTEPASEAGDPLGAGA